MAKKKRYPRKVETLTHHADSRVNIPTAEYEPVLDEKDKNPVRVAYPRPSTGHLSEEKDKRVRDLDPQLVWRGKDEQDRADLVVHALCRASSRLIGHHWSRSVCVDYYVLSMSLQRCGSGYVRRGWHSKADTLGAMCFPGEK